MDFGIFKRNKYPISLAIACSLIVLGATAWPNNPNKTLSIKLLKIQTAPRCPLPTLNKTNRDLSKCDQWLFQATHGLCFMAREQYKSHWIVFKNDIEAYTSLCVTLDIRRLKGLPLFH